MDELKHKRFAYLHALCQETNGSQSAIVNMWALGERLGFARQETSMVAQYLDEERLLRFATLGGDISITHLGIRIIKGELYHPVRSGQTGRSMEYESLRERGAKNVAEPIRVDRVRIKPGAAAARATTTKSAGLSRWRRAALAVTLVLLAAAAGVAIWNSSLRLPW